MIRLTRVDLISQLTCDPFDLLLELYLLQLKSLF
jgi:hypothetical protein